MSSKLSFLSLSLTLLAAVGCARSVNDADFAGGTGAHGAALGEPTFCNVQELVFDVSCVGCHDGSNTSIPDYRPGVSQQIIGAPSLRTPGATLVVPGDAEASLLFRKIAGTQAANEGARMPRGGAPLSDELIALVGAWIDAGASTDCGPAEGEGEGEPVGEGEGEGEPVGEGEGEPVGEGEGEGEPVGEGEGEPVGEGEGEGEGCTSDADCASDDPYVADGVCVYGVCQG